jgi:hypothetical protein
MVVSPENFAQREAVQGFSASARIAAASRPEFRATFKRGRS